MKIEFDIRPFIVCFAVGVVLGFCNVPTLVIMAVGVIIIAGFMWVGAA